MRAFSNKPMIIIAGPTATGKSSLGVRLAKDMDGEIVSADSMQVYKYMDIGTAKITKEEMEGIPHHMLDVCEPTKSYSIGDYKDAAKTCVEDILSRGKLPMVVGGTGFYIHALLYDTDFGNQEADPRIRERIEKEYDELGAGYVFDRLKVVDPDAAATMHMNNKKRVVRALEFYETNGYRISEHNTLSQAQKSPYDYIFLVLNRDREALYQLIDKRVDMMMEAGLAQEIQRLLEMGCRPGDVPMQGIGYKEFFDCDDIETTVYNIKNNSHHYSKKQITWFKREENTKWINSPVSEDDYKWILKECTKLLV